MPIVMILAWKIVTDAMGVILTILCTDSLIPCAIDKVRISIIFLNVSHVPIPISPFYPTPTISKGREIACPNTASQSQRCFYRMNEDPSAIPRELLDHLRY